MSTNNKIVCILGMHRSGTSMIARILNLCGLSLGEPGEMFTPTYGNEKGHWENNRFMEINMKVIKLFSNEKEDWNAKPTFPKEWQNSKKINNLKIKARKLIAEYDKRYTSWGWKDPRNCITLPFWQSILGDRLIYVIVIRQPIDIANSLLKRNDYPPADGLMLWNRYISDAITFTKNLPRYFISSERIFINQEKEIRSLIKFINNKDIIYNSTIKKQTNKFVSKDIWHNQKHSPFLNGCQDETAYFISQLHSQAIIELSNLYQKKIIEKDIAINSLQNKIDTIENSKTFKICHFLLTIKYETLQLLHLKQSN